MQQFDLGRVLSRMFGMIRAGLATTGVFLLVIAALGQLLSAAGQSVMLSTIKPDAGASSLALAALSLSGLLGFVVLMLAATLVGSVGYGGGLAGYLAEHTGKTISLRESLAIGISRMLPVTGLTILWMLGIMLGAMLLLVPGLILIAMWSVAIPAMINEKIGVFEAFARSRALTKGSRLWIFLTLIVLLILAYVPVVVIGAILVSLIGLTGGMTQIAQLGEGGFNLMNLAVGIPTAWIMTMLLNAGLASLYVETVEAKGGAVDETLTQVFD